MNAIILAAGSGIRLSPLTKQTPKPLTAVQGKPIIERQIECLKEIGIKEIYIVTGYMHESFDYLRKKFGVVLIHNERHTEFNNIYSLYLAKEHFKNTYILEADVFITKNFLKRDLIHSTYFSGLKSNFINEWLLVFDTRIRHIHLYRDLQKENPLLKNTHNYIMSGISYWNEETTGIIGKALQIKIDKIFKESEGTSAYKNDYWDSLVIENIDQLYIEVNKINASDWYEIDTIQDLNTANSFLNEAILTSDQLQINEH